MRALIVSDTHGRHDNFAKVYENFKPFDMVIHAGDVVGEELWYQMYVDCELHMVRGNCDWDSELPTVDTFAFGSHKIFLVHGHRHEVDYDDNVLAWSAKENGCDIAIYGHTHVPDDSVVDGVRIINPGSLSRPRQENHRPSFAIFSDDRRGNLLTSIN